MSYHNIDQHYDIYSSTDVMDRTVECYSVQFPTTIDFF